MHHQLDTMPVDITACNDLPRHLGIIPDGNRRWATERGLPVAAGFRAGAERIPHVLDLCSGKGVDFVSLWMMSESNLRRPPREVVVMLDLTAEIVERLAGMRRWRLHAIGRLDLVPDWTAEVLHAAERATADVAGVDVNLAVGYAGRTDITSAVRSFLRSPAVRSYAGERIADSLTPEQIGTYLSTGGQPDLDLVIRTSGEVRLSGFMIWQTAESELYFCDKLWPDFEEEDFEAALTSFRNRDRRFGF
jgi:short-chain Z-isoprenyl diphosphate synthase